MGNLDKLSLLLPHPHPSRNSARLFFFFLSEMRKELDDSRAKMTFDLVYNTQSLSSSYLTAFEKLHLKTVSITT